MKTGPHSSPCDELIVKPAWNPHIRDDVSIGSTLTADAAPKKPLYVEPSPEDFCPQQRADEEPLPPRSPTRVSFDESQNSYYDNELMSAEDCEELWYNVDEFGKFKHDIIRTVKLLLKHENKHPSPGSVSNVLEHTYVCCFEHDRETRKNILPPELQAAIKNQYRHNDEYLLGLERLIVRRIGKDRNELRRCLLEIVNELQSKKTWPNKQVLAENIARVSQEATRASRLFARHLGGAQVPYLLTRRPSHP